MSQKNAVNKNDQQLVQASEVYSTFGDSHCYAVGKLHCYVGCVCVLIYIQGFFSNCILKSLLNLRSNSIIQQYLSLGSARDVTN